MAAPRGGMDAQPAGAWPASSARKPLPLYLRIRPQTANELGGTRSLQAPQVLSTKLSAPKFSFGGSTSARLSVVPATSPGPIYHVRSTLGNGSVSFGSAEQRPRPDTSSSRNSPGPASYTLPASVGSSMVLGRMRSSRASSFGTAPARIDHFPGSTQAPGAKYDVPRSATREGVDRPGGARWAKGARYADPPDLATSPGPMSYTIPSSVGRGIPVSTMRNEPGVRFGTSSRDNGDYEAVRLKHARNYPGAASYTLGSQLGLQLLSTKRSTSGRPFTTADRFKQLAVDESFLEGNGYAPIGFETAPGPGTYVV